MLPLYPAQQLLRGIAANLTATVPGADGEPLAGLTVTVDVARADGTVLYTAAATVDNGDGTYSLAATAADLTSLDFLTATWKVGGVTRLVTHHEIVGAWYFSAARARADDPNISSLAPDADLFARARGTVEAVFEKICNVAFVPRYRRWTLDGSNLRALLLPDPMVRTIREVKFLYTSTSSYTLTSNELAALSVNIDGVLGYLNSQDVVQGIHTAGRFPSGFQNVVVGYEHGFDAPPPDLRDAAYSYLREILQRPRQSVPDRAITFTAGNGGTYRLTVPDAFSTGNPWIDAVLARHAFEQVGFA